jgi:hypothetical protein
LYRLHLTSSSIASVKINGNLRTFAEGYTERQFDDALKSKKLFSASLLSSKSNFLRVITATRYDLLSSNFLILPSSLTTTKSADVPHERR